MLTNEQLNLIKFGNPNRQHLLYLEKETYLDSLLNELKSYPPPDNYGQDSSEEILYLINLTNQLSQADEKVISRFILYDNDFEFYIPKIIAEKGLPIDEVNNLIIELHNDILPLLVKLKYHYNRIRPQQLALYKNMPLYVWKTKNADSPSYPSGHCFQAKIYTEVLGNKYPQFYKGLAELARDITYSREYLGVHFPSDTAFANYTADVVLKHPEFAKKYKL